MEPLELRAYDWLLQLQAARPQTDPRIVLVTITESDIQNQGGWPISDSTLAKVLTRLTAYHPRAVGLDIYRDLPVPPGHEELEEVFRNNRHIIATMKFGEGASPGIPPPSVLANSEQVSFSDVLVDRDSIVRRALLYQDDGRTVVYSFAFRLALLYLQPVGIVPQPDTSNPKHVRLGQTTIRPLEANDGGYVGADARGYQFLLDFKDGTVGFPSFDLTTLLSGVIDPNAIKDKIVLIGMTAQSVPHFFYTPLSSGLKADHSISGVALHANIVSQLIRFALEGIPLTKTLSEPEEAFWILLWGLLGGTLALWMPSAWLFSVMSLSGLLLIFVCASLAFLYAWWIPLVPPALNWLVSAGVITAYMLNRERKQLAAVMHLVALDVSPEVQEATWQQRDQNLDSGQPGSQRVISTVLFTELVDFTSVDQRMKVGVYERSEGGERTLRPYEYQIMVWEQVEGSCREVVTLLKRANKRGRVTPEILDNLKKTGHILFELLIPQQAREKLYSTKARDLILYVDDKLVQVPWELLFDGREFLSRRFAMGRVVSTRQALTSRSSRTLKPPFNVLVLADPRADLEASYREGIQLRDFLDERSEIFHVDSKTGSVDVAFVKKNLRDYDIVHYAGHADYRPENPSESGWLLRDGRLRASEVSAMGGLQPMPSLVFSNACQSGQTGEWEIQEGYEQQIFGLANAYLLSGVQHYIGTCWEIPDEHSFYFAKVFYSYLAQGEKIGEAVRRARQELVETYGEETIVWASYMLYGAPTFSFASGSQLKRKNRRAS